MIKFEDECCGCSTESYPCLGNSCPLKYVSHFYCDCCKDEVDSEELYEYEGQDLCKECLLGKVPKAY